MVSKQTKPSVMKTAHTGGYRLGHTLVIGNTRAGKLVLASMLVRKTGDSAAQREGRDDD